MKLTSFLAIVASLVIVQSAVIPSREGLEPCQVEYSQLVGNLVASEGTAAVSTLWRLVFNKLDLNGDSKVGAAELVINLETANILAQSDTEAAYSSVRDLIRVGSNHESKSLDESEFKDTVGATLGRSSSSIEAPYTYLCEYVTMEAREIITSFQNFTRNAVMIKEDLRDLLQESKSPEKALKNIWEGIFKSIDVDDDEEISLQDMIQLHHQYINQNDDGLSDELTEIFQISSKNDKSSEELSMTNEEFYSSIKSLLYDTDNFVDEIATITQMKGWSSLSQILASSIADFKSKYQQSLECKHDYEDKLIKYLAADKGFSSEYLFTIFDAKKDGVLDYSEISHAVTSTMQLETEFSFATVAQHQISSFNIDQFSFYLPDRVVDTVTTANESNLELSRLSTNQQETWKIFCHSVKSIISQFPLNLVVKAQDGEVDISQSIDIIINSSEEDLVVLPDITRLYQKVKNIMDDQVKETTTPEVEATTASMEEETTPSPMMKTTTMEMIEETTIEQQQAETTQAFIEEETTQQEVDTTTEQAETTTVVADVTTAPNDVVESSTRDEVEGELADLVKEIINDMKEGKKVPESEEMEAEADVEKITEVNEEEGEEIEKELQELFNMEKTKTNKVKNVSVEEKELMALLNDMQ